MKKTALSLVSIIVTMCATAQNENFNKSIKIGIGAAIGLPLGTYNHVEGMGYEAGVLAEFPTTKSLNITGNVSYLSFTGKNGVKIDGGVIPVLVGAKIKLANKVYGHAQIGASFATEGNGGAAFTYSPSIGYQLSRNFDLSLRYWAATKNQVTESYIGVRAGLTF